jgi:hypothetical protein
MPTIGIVGATFCGLDRVFDPIARLTSYRRKQPLRTDCREVRLTLLVGSFPYSPPSTLTQPPGLLMQLAPHSESQLTSPRHLPGGAGTSMPFPN